MGNLVALASRARNHDSTPVNQLAERAVYTVVEVAQLLSLSRGTAYALVRDGIIPALRLGGYRANGVMRRPAAGQNLSRKT